MAASASSLSTLEDVFEEMTKMRTICCPFSSNGLAWLKEERNREAYAIVDSACDGVPAKMPNCCAGHKGTFNHGSKNQNLLAMKDHASRNMSGYVDPEESDAEEELEPEHVMHRRLHKWIETAAVSKQDQLNQMKRQLAGQNGQHKAKERKLTDRVMDESAQKQRALEHVAVLQQKGDEQRSELDALKAVVNDEKAARERVKAAREREMANIQELWRTEANRKAVTASLVASAAATAARERDDKKWLVIELEHSKRMRQHEKEKFAEFLREKQAEMKRRLDMVAEASREEARETEHNMQQMQEMLRQGGESVQQSQREIDELNAKLKAVKEEMEEQSRHYGAVAGQAHQYSEAQGTVYKNLKANFPPGSGSRVPWKVFGEVDLGELAKLGLREEHQIAATAWNDGFWLQKPDGEGDATVPPFIAEWAFERKGTNERGEEEFAVREADEVIRYPARMPASYTGPPRFREITKSAAFVKYLRANYPKKAADAILAYLLGKYREYLAHSGGVGFTGYSVIYKVWDAAKNREMNLPEMVELQTALSAAK